SPYGKTDQPDFLNCVLKIETDLSSREVLKLCLKIEKNLGRVRHETWGPRTIDIDLLLYEHEIVAEPDLQIPHPGIPQREFLLKSLVELCPEYLHPLTHKSIREMSEELKGKSMNKTATIILAAGQGTRMKSELPKVVHQLAGKPMIGRVVETALKINSELIAVVVGYKKDIVIESIPANPNLKFVEQNQQKGTGHAVMMAEDVFRNFDGTVFILCGDVPLLRAQTLFLMLKHHERSQAACTVLTAILAEPQMYGRILRNADGNVQRIVEFKDASEAERQINEINTGIYCFDSQSLFAALKEINCNNNQHEYYLTDTLEILNRRGKLVTSVVLDDIIEAAGVNSQDQLKALESEYLKRKAHFDGEENE
nr:2-amino-4-hydroxy-6-hydroxymethyldihydropteridine diphosphokinase [Candidatus Cloacimonadota bacterium]